MFYEIHPIRATSTLTSAFTTTDGSATATITFVADHGLMLAVLFYVIILIGLPAKQDSRFSII